MKLLELKIRRSVAGSCYLLINQQATPHLNLPYAGDTLRLESAGHPQLTNSIFYLRGNSTSSDYTEIRVNKAQRDIIIRTLMQFCGSNGFRFSINISNNSSIEFLCSNGSFPLGHIIVNNLSEAISVVQSWIEHIDRKDTFTLDDLGPGSELYFTNMSTLPVKSKPRKVTETKYSCTICNKKDIVANKMQSSTICRKCYDEIPECITCHKKNKILNKYNDITIGEVLICDRCYHLSNCIDCKKEGLTLLFKPSIKIHENGKNECLPSSHCNKCSQKLTTCKHCSYSYDHNIYSICPCRIPKTFKDMIYPYNENVLNHLPLDEGTKELFGIEIEVGVHLKNRHKFQEVYQQTSDVIYNNAITLYDSSIDYIDKSNGIENQYKGFEIVSRPLTYKNILGFIKHLSENRHPLLRCWEVGTTGIHIHVNKQFLSNIDIGKILIFINDKKNRKFIKMIAKREDGKYAKFVPRTMADYCDDSPECHYYAINTNKPHTIEFRIFRGTLNQVTMLSYIQFVKSLIEYVKSNSINSLKYSDYVNWLMNTTTQYPELTSRIRREDLENIDEEGQI